MIVTYFIQGEHGGPVKIGRSTKRGMTGRLASLQTGNPDVLVVRGLVPSDREHVFHRQWAQWRLRGEWYVAVEEMLRYAPDLLVEDQRSSGIDVVAEDRIRAEAWSAAFRAAVDMVPALMQETANGWREALHDQADFYRGLAEHRDADEARRLRYALGTHVAPADATIQEEVS